MKSILPCLIKNDGSYIRMINTVFFTKFRIVSFCIYKFFSNFINLSLRKFFSSFFFWNNVRWESSFFNAVVNIVFLSANKEMVRIYARRVVAFMKHEHVFWDLLNEKIICKSMRSPQFPGFKFSDSGLKVSITKTIFAFCPKPTSVCFLNTFKKSIYIIFHKEELLSWPFLTVNQ